MNYIENWEEFKQHIGNHSFPPKQHTKEEIIEMVAEWFGIILLLISLSLLMVELIEA